MGKGVRYAGEEDRPKETVVQWTVNLSWRQWRLPGVSDVTILVDGCSTSTEAIEKAVAMVRPLRADYPKEVRAASDTYEREIPQQIADGSVVTDDSDR